MRAISQDIYSSKIIGINVERLYVFTMMLVLIPVIVGTLIVAPVWSVEPGMGSLYMTTAILVAILGGLGNIKGTIIASFLIGFTHALVSFVLEGAAIYESFGFGSGHDYPDGKTTGDC